jgi:hypothetical protein
MTTTWNDSCTFVLAGDKLSMVKIGFWLRSVQVEQRFLKVKYSAAVSNELSLTSRNICNYQSSLASMNIIQLRV